MTSNETSNYEKLFDHIQEEIERATVTIRETKGFKFLLKTFFLLFFDIVFSFAFLNEMFLFGIILARTLP